MKILLVGSYQYPMYAPAFAYGFRKLGHKVIEIDYMNYRFKSANVLASFFNKVQDRYHNGLKMRQYNAAIIDAVEREKPDLVFFYRCYHVWPSTLEEIKGKALLMSYNNDDPFGKVPSKRYFRYHIAGAKYCDINFVYRKKNIEDYAQIGIHNTQILLPYYLERNNYCEDVEDCVPVAFIGHFENDGRDGLIKAMVDAGIPVSVYNGSYWDRAPQYEAIKSIIKPGIHSQEYNHLLNQCQIALVFLSKLNSDTYTRRCFEIPATKTLMLSEYTDDLNRLFPEDECAVYFHDKEELVEKCKALLSNPSEIRRIAENGYKRLSEIGGSEVDRCKQIIETYKNAKI